MTTMHKSRWFLPLFSVALGIACFVALWIGGEEGSAWFALALMSVVGLAFLSAAASTWCEACAATAVTSTGRGSTSTQPHSRGTS